VHRKLLKNSYTILFLIVRVESNIERVDRGFVTWSQSNRLVASCTVLLNKCIYLCLVIYDYSMMFFNIRQIIFFGIFIDCTGLRNILVVKLLSRSSAEKEISNNSNRSGNFLSAYSGTIS